MAKIMKSRRTAAQWSELVSEWSASGKSAQAFAAERGVNPGTLSWWRRQLLRRGDAVSRSCAAVERPSKATFAEVQVRPTGGGNTGRVEVVAPSGHVVRVDRGFDVEVLQAVLSAVERC